MKRVLSVLLTVSLLVGCLSAGFVGVATGGYSPNKSDNISIEVTPEQEAYNWGDELVFSVKATNNSDKNYRNVKIRAQANKAKFFYDGESNTVSIDELAAGESKNVEIRVLSSVPNLIQRLFILPIYYIIDFLSPFAFSASDFDATQLVRVGAFRYKFGFSVTDGSEADQIDTSQKFIVSISYNYEGAKKIPDQLVSYGDTAIEPIIPDRDGFVPVGWFSDMEQKTFFDFSEPITKDVNVFLGWINVDNSSDSDSDGLSDEIELFFGSDPSKNDTDDDGVSDYNELNWLNTKPNSIDSNNDGILDCDDDADEDGLTNGEEDRIGTNPAYYDSDYDKLSDYDEIYIYLTDPLNEDTDGDGVDDGTEVISGSNPLVQEDIFVTEETFGEVNDSMQVAVTASVTTDGNGAGTLEINEVTHTDNPLISDIIPGYLGSAFDFSTEGAFVSAELTFYYDESLGTLGDDFQPRIYYVNEETGEFEELPNQTVENGRVIAEVTHFSTYVLLNKVEFDRVWDNEIKPPVDEYYDENNSMDVVFVIDYSYSMTWNDSSFLRKTVTNEFVSKLREENDRAAVVKFISVPTVICDLTSDKEKIVSAVNSIVDNNGYGTNAGTNGSAGIKSALDILDDSSAKYKYVIFLTDGEDTKVSYSYSTLIDRAAQNGVVIYSIGLGTADEALLSSIASGTGGKYYFASQAGQLVDIYDNITVETVDYITDSNGDGISDYYTDLINSGKLLTSSGSYEFIGATDMFGVDCADWDDDGLLNGEEIQVCNSSRGAYIKVNSNPFLVDSDGDGIDDYTEVKGHRRNNGPRLVVKATSGVSSNYSTNPMKITQKGAFELQDLLNDDYVYVEQVNQKSVANKISGWFDWQKKDETKETYIDYFYDYATETSINAAAAEREALAKREQTWDKIEMGISILKCLKTTLDLETDLGSKDSAVKAQITRYTNLNKTVLDLYNKKEYNEVLENFSGVNLKKIEEDWSFVSGLKDDIEKIYKGFSENTDELVEVVTQKVKSATAIISVISSVTGKFELLKTSQFSCKGLRDFSRKYQVWMGKRPLGDVKIGTAISVVSDGIDLVTDIADLCNLYGKVQANNEAFNEYLELITHISKYAKNKYTKNAAGDIARIVCEREEEYYRQLSEAIAKTSFIAVGHMLESIVGDFCPYVKAAQMIVTLVKIGISLTGMTSYAKALVKSQAIYEISKGCVYLLDGKYEINGDSFSYKSEDYDTITLYLTQLAQSRIVGEESICTFLKTFSLAHVISKWITGSSNKETDSNFATIIRFIYSEAQTLKLNLSKALPRYPRNYNPA